MAGRTSCMCSFGLRNPMYAIYSTPHTVTFIHTISLARLAYNIVTRTRATGTDLYCAVPELVSVFLSTIEVESRSVEFISVIET